MTLDRTTTRWGLYFALIPRRRTGSLSLTPCRNLIPTEEPRSGSHRTPESEPSQVSDVAVGGAAVAVVVVSRSDRLWPH